MNHAIDETTDAGYQSPRDPTEIWLTRQWQDILGFTVGIRENFFGVGTRPPTVVQRTHVNLAGALRELIG